MHSDNHSGDTPAAPSLYNLRLPAIDPAFAPEWSTLPSFTQELRLLTVLRREFAGCVGTLQYTGNSSTHQKHCVVAGLETAL
eukprot:m.253008 g.253008  ORF g.253008 m.253008 type:complete len:82 (-) comp26515_c0_seq17:25-270(-)